MTTLLSVPAKFVATAHTSIAASAFIVALFAGWWGGKWKPLCTNRVARWPVEWFPSVSAVAGDHPHSRAPFHILIALCAGPRFLVLVLQWLSHRHGTQPRSSGPVSNGQSPVAGRSTAQEAGGARTRAAATKAEAALDQATEPLTAAVQQASSGPAGLADIELIVGLARTFCCGGWMYVTSRDSAGLHDMFMIVYLVLNLPWMYLSAVNAPSALSRRRRKMAMAGFLATVPPLIWMYYRHSVLKIPGAYTHYAFFEWSLVIWDITFDYFAVLDLQHLQISVVDTTRTGDEKGLRWV